MSIYSGFVTRDKEEQYNNYVQGLIYTLQRRIVKFYNKQQTDETKFVGIVQRLYRNMKQMQKLKFLQPKFTDVLKDLVDYLGFSKKNQHSNMDNKNTERSLTYNEIIHKKSPKHTKFDKITNITDKSNQIIKEYQNSKTKAYTPQVISRASDDVLQSDKKQKMNDLLDGRTLTLNPIKNSRTKYLKVFKTSRNIIFKGDEHSKISNQ